MLIHSIPDKMTITWNGHVNAIVTKWENYFISLEEYSTAIVDAALPHGLSNDAKAWIIDASAAKGALHPDIVKFIETDVYPRLVQCGIRDIVLICPFIKLFTREFRAIIHQERMRLAMQLYYLIKRPGDSFS